MLRIVRAQKAHWLLVLTSSINIAVVVIVIIITVQSWTPSLKDRQRQTSGVCSEGSRKGGERNGFQISYGELEGFGNLQPGEQEWLE